MQVKIWYTAKCNHQHRNVQAALNCAKTAKKPVKVTAHVRVLP